MFSMVLKIRMKKARDRRCSAVSTNRESDSTRFDDGNGHRGDGRDGAPTPRLRCVPKAAKLSGCTAAAQRPGRRAVTEMIVPEWSRLTVTGDRWCWTRCCWTRWCWTRWCWTSVSSLPTLDWFNTIYGRRAELNSDFGCTVSVPMRILQRQSGLLENSINAHPVTTRSFWRWARSNRHCVA